MLNLRCPGNGDARVLAAGPKVCRGFSLWVLQDHQRSCACVRLQGLSIRWIAPQCRAGNGTTKGRADGFSWVLQDHRQSCARTRLQNLRYLTASGLMPGRNHWRVQMRDIAALRCVRCVASMDCLFGAIDTCSHLPLPATPMDCLSGLNTCERQCTETGLHY